MDEKDTIERKVAETILQRPDTIKIGTRTFDVPKPTTAALIMASAAASKLPRVKLQGGEDLVSEVLRIGKDCTPIGEVLASLLTDARGSMRDGVARKEYEARLKETTAALLEESTPSELMKAAIKLLNTSDVGDFFGLTTFLVEVNLTKATKVEGTTASGAQ